MRKSSRIWRPRLTLWNRRTRIGKRFSSCCSKEENSKARTITSSGKRSTSSTRIRTSRRERQQLLPLLLDIGGQANFQRQKRYLGKSQRFCRARTLHKQRLGIFTKSTISLSDK